MTISFRSCSHFLALWWPALQLQVCWSFHDSPNCQGQPKADPYMKLQASPTKPLIYDRTQIRHENIIQNICNILQLQQNPAWRPLPGPERPQLQLGGWIDVVFDILGLNMAEDLFFLLFLICGVDVVLNDLNGTADHLKMREECWIWGNLNSTKSKTSGNVPTFSTVVGTRDCSEISTFSLLAEKKRVFPPSSTRFPDGEVQCLQLRWSLHAHFGVQSHVLGFLQFQLFLDFLTSWPSNPCVQSNSVDQKHMFGSSQSCAGSSLKGRTVCSESLSRVKATVRHLHTPWRSH